MKLVRLIFGAGVLLLSGAAFSANVMILGQYQTPKNISYGGNRTVDDDICLIWMAKTNKQFDNEVVDRLTNEYFGDIGAAKKIKYEKDIRTELDNRFQQIKNTDVFGLLWAAQSSFDSVNKTFVYTMSELDSQAGACKWPERDEWSFDTHQNMTIRFKMGENDLPWVDIISRGLSVSAGDFGKDGVYTIAWVKVDKPKTTKTRYHNGAGYLPSLPWRLIGVHTIYRKNGQTSYYGSNIKEKGFTTEDAIHEFERQILVDFKGDNKPAVMSTDSSPANSQATSPSETQQQASAAVDPANAKKIFEGLKSIFGK